MNPDEMAFLLEILGANQVDEYARRVLATGETASVIPLTYGRARICLHDGPASYSNSW